MRVTAETKKATRQRILESARNLFCNKGFNETTTRDLSTESQIAAGTLFNYFPNKEAIAVTLMAERLNEVERGFTPSSAPDAMLDEQLFAHVNDGLRSLRPYRGFIGPVIEASLSPLNRSNCRDAVEALRIEHLETVMETLRLRGVETPTSVAMHLYWTLYLGVMSFWASDESPNQEETLVLLDQSMRMFVASLTQLRSPSSTA